VVGWGAHVASPTSASSGVAGVLYVCVSGPRSKSFFFAGFRELTDKRLGKEESAAPGQRGKSFFSAGFSELTDTRLGKEDSVAADHMLLIGRSW
jgi:hypothetical protein